MYIFEIACHVQTHKCVFVDKNAAELELVKLREILNEGRWSKNREEKPTHTVTCPTGNVVVVLEKVEMIRIIDSDVDKNIWESYNEENDVATTERLIKYRQSLKDAGVADIK